MYKYRFRDFVYDFMWWREERREKKWEVYWDFWSDESIKKRDEKNLNKNIKGGYYNPYMKTTI